MAGFRAFRPLISVLAVCVLIFGCTDEHTEYETNSIEEPDFIQKVDSRTLLVRGDWQYPPFEFLDEEGEPAGFNVDIIRAVQKVLNLDLRIELGPWHQVREELEEEKIHILMGMFKTPERARRVDFTIPHFIASYNLFVPKDSGIRSIEDAKGSRILVQRGDLAHDFLLEEGFNSSLVVMDSVLEVIQGLDAGEGDCAVASLTQGGSILDHYNIKSVKVIPESVLTGSYCIAVRKGDTELLALVNEGLNFIKNSGEYDRIYEKWFGLVEPARFLGFKIVRILITAAGSLLLAGGLWTVTLRRQVSQKTAALNRELARSREIQENLEKAVRAKTLFLANISHELRTPVNGFLGMISLLRKTELSEAQSEYIDMADYSADYLLRLIDDLLDAARLDNSSIPLNIGEFSPGKLVENCIKMMEKPARDKNITMKAEVPEPSVLFPGDKTRIGQVVINLLSNAVKYSESGVIEVLAKVDDDLLITVSDQGVGIPEDELSNIFDPFRQLENPYTKTHQGAGLGLAIVKSLVDLMGGHMEVKSKLGRGSSFTMIIPAEHPARQHLQDNIEKKEAYLQKADPVYVQRILIVEDERINMMYLRRILENAGYTVLEATSGQGAVETALQENPDLIFMDIGLPVMDGKEATRILKSREEFFRVPIIALTAHSGKDEAREFIDSGGNAVIVKPFREFQILEAIKKRYAWTSYKHTV